MASDEEDDYMNMIIEEPQQKETLTQKKRRLQREVHYTPLAVTLIALNQQTIDLSTFTRPKPARVSLQKPSAPPKKPPNAMQRLQRAHSTPPTRGSR
jgi:hypothetical protein